MKDVLLDEFSEYQECKGKMVRVVVMPMTKEDARRIFPYRPFSKYAESRFGGNSLTDDACLSLNGDAKQCRMCSASTKNVYLVNGVCPDCDGRSEANGGRPREK